MRGTEDNTNTAQLRPYLLQYGWVGLYRTQGFVHHGIAKNVLRMQQYVRRCTTEGKRTIVAAIPEFPGLAWHGQRVPCPLRQS